MHKLIKILKCHMTNDDISCDTHTLLGIKYVVSHKIMLRSHKEFNTNTVGDTMTKESEVMFAQQSACITRTTILWHGTFISPLRATA